jgi:hypothetical protein
MTLLADRGFLHEQLLDYLQKLGWHFRLRLKGSTLVHLPGQPISAVKELCTPGFRKPLLPAGVDFRSSRGTSLSGPDLPA